MKSIRIKQLGKLLVEDFQERQKSWTAKQWAEWYNQQELAYDRHVDDTLTQDCPF
jgi:hypothetical protein